MTDEDRTAEAKKINDDDDDDKCLNISAWPFTNNVQITCKRKYILFCILLGLQSPLFQYPDAPNLFTNIRRPYRPDVWTEFSRTWLISIIGVSLVITGIVTLFYNEVSSKRFTKKSRQNERISKLCSLKYFIETSCHNCTSFGWRPA